MLVFPFSYKTDTEFWLSYSNSLSSSFPYLSLQANPYSFPSFVNMKTNTEEPTQISIAEPALLSPDVSSISNASQNSPYSYDMTAYINNTKLRESDSIHMAKIFDKQWHLFSSNRANWSTDYADVPFRDTFHGTRRCLQFLQSPEQIFKYYFNMCNIATPSSVSEILNQSIQIVIPFFSHMKAFIHNHIDQLPPISYCYSELDTIAGYPLDKHRSLTDDPHEWLSQDVNDLHSAQWWANNITSLLTRSQVSHHDPIISFIDFLKSPWLWVTNGASSISKLLLNGKRVKTKFGAALSLTPTELFACVMHSLNPKSVNIDIFVKQDERGFKRRLIANMDLGSYLVAAYIRYLIEWLDGPIPHWMTATTNADKDRTVIDLLRLKHIAMPLDESQFDHHLSRAAWRGFLKSLDFLFPNNFGVHLFHVLFQNSLFFDRITNSRGPWIKGMPSGLAITSIGNTLFNYIKQQSIISPIHYALGDDVLVFSDGYSLDRISKYYATFGAEVNVKKNWQSSHYAEFLHFLYSTHARVGLPARIYGSLMYGLQFKDVTPLQRINELTTMFKDFYDRAVLHFDFNLVARDLSRAVSRGWAGFNTQAALTWLHVPKALNGFGFLPYVNKSFVVKNEVVERHKYLNNLYTMPDQIIVKKSSWHFSNFHLNDAQFHTGNSFHLPPILNIQDWINRLNFQIPGISNTVQKYALETIPLPEMEFISSSRMSFFATQLHYNAFPNLSGSATSRTTRFIKASLALAEQVIGWMKQYSIFVYV